MCCSDAQACCHADHHHVYQRHDVNDIAAPGFLIDFGTRVRELNPLQLFTLEGTNRSDVVFDVVNGRISLTAYVLNTSAVAPIT